MADETPAISVQHVSKTFKLPHEKHSGIKQYLVNILQRKKGYEVQHVLKGLTFDIHKGDFFGIVGRNGSGKSTLLKILSGIYTPDRGKVAIHGSLTPFIELGVGFNPELTGRENVYLNGAMLGFSRSEVDGMYDEIVEFAELERFMDQKLKNYSSGMQVRLAFSIAIRADTDILILDEVIAVGDEAFQRKCFSYFDKLKRAGKTVVLVTHDMGSVERFCNKAIFIEDGEIKKSGKPHIVAAAYSRSNDRVFNESQKTERREKTDDEFDIETLDSNGKPSISFQTGDTMIVRLKWKQDGVGSGGVALFCEGGEYVFGPNTYQDKYQLKSIKKQLEYHVRLNLNEGKYFLKAGLNGKNDLDRIAFIDEGPVITVSRQHNSPRWGGITRLDYSWK